MEPTESVMQKSTTSQSAARTRISLVARLMLLPLAERSFVLVLLGCSLFPPVASLYARWVDSSGSTFLGRVGQQSTLLWPLCLAVAVVTLLLMEPPRVFSLRSYGTQLHERYRRVQSTYDAAFQRLTQEQQAHADHAPPEP